MTIGPSHFMTMELDFNWLKMIWKYSIVPEAEEWIQDPEKLQEFVNLPESFKPDSIIPHHEE